MRLRTRYAAALGVAALRVAVAAALSGAVAIDTARAQDDDRALSAFARPAVAAPRGVALQREQWESRLRSPDRFGPPVLREADAALLTATRAGRWDEALQLLKSGKAGANAQDETHGNALVLAARAGQDELVRELLKHGADTSRVGEDGFTPLGAAAFAGQRSTVRLLLRAGVDAARWGATGQTALHLASVAGQVDVLDEFLRAHVDIEMLNRQRESALDLAAAAGQQDAMGWLIKAGADLQAAGRR